MVKPFSPENFPYTLVHDDLQAVIKALRGTSVKVLLFVMKASRSDFTHFVPTQLSLNEITDGSGVSYNSVSPALAQLVEMDILTRTITGRHPGTQTPLYSYGLNLDYEAATPEFGAAPTPKNGAATPKNGAATPEFGAAPTPKNGVATPEFGAAPTPKNGVATPEFGAATPKIGVEPTMNGVESLQSTPQSTDPAAPVDLDHDHENDLGNDLIKNMVRLGLYQSLAKQVLSAMGIENARLWYAYVIDPDNKIDTPAAYLYKCCVQSRSDPPIPYTDAEIERLERRHQLQRARDQADAAGAPAERAPIPADPLADLWARVLVELRSQMTQATFDQWLAQTGLVSVEGGLAVVSTSNHYTKEWLTARLKPAVLRTLAAVAESSGCTIQDVIFEEVSYVQNPA